MKRNWFAVALCVSIALATIDHPVAVSANTDSGLVPAQQAAVAGSQPPPQAASAGNTRLDFYDDFDYPDTSFLAFHGAGGKTWNASLWYKANAASPKNFSISNSVLTINNNAISTIQNATPFAGRTWQGGYFEARIYCAAHCGFYLGSYAWAKMSGQSCQAADCETNRQAAGKQLDSQYGGANEIDIIEAYGTAPKAGAFTLHRGGMGAGQHGYGAPDDHIAKSAKFNAPLIRNWHTYGLLWTKTTLYWYVDNQLTASAPAYRSTWQPSFMIISVAPDGWSNTSKGTADDEVITKVDWVKVWEPAK